MNYAKQTPNQSNSRPVFARGTQMTLDLQTISPIVALIAGVLILLMPRLLNYVVAFYLIAIGILGLFPHLR
jgi:ABC-type amino acid transport system permease subunit